MEPLQNVGANNMISGIDYVFYSNKSPFDIEESFISLLKEKWVNLIVDEFERSESRLELFFSKDKEMYSIFDETGYHLNENGEGCFMLISSVLDQFESKVKIINIGYPQSRSNTEPYDAVIMLRNIWEYTLVLPSEITEGDFSKDIYGFLEAVLR
ncbi:hypothetical protein ACTV70_004308 [Cronobacter dublinensis]